MFDADIPEVSKIVRRHAMEETEAAQRRWPGDDVTPRGDVTPIRGGRSQDFGGTTEPPTVDVNRLTDQVLRAIDRRIIAQRERLGGT